jgi:metallo-beta-lactamase family protein
LKDRDSASVIFHGAARTVTGSKYLIETSVGRVLVDCGMFQGERELRTRNWQRWPFDPSSVDAVLLTHAHLDHSGMLPVLCRAGFEGPVYCTPSTAALAEILLTDSGRIHEEDARHANRHGYSRHRPALPLYTEADALDCLSRFEPVDFDERIAPVRGLRARFRHAGHILGAAWLALDLHGGRRVVFSGDLGRPDDPIMRPPTPLEDCDVLVLESTYGDLLHDSDPPERALLDVIERTRKRGGMVLIPAFAVGRAQAVLYLLWRLREAGEIERVPIFLDSPMAIDATEIFRLHPEDHRLTPAAAQATCAIADYVTSREESRALNDRHGPMIVISASGMMSGGRILHHLRNHAGDPRNTILFTGFQAPGSRGAEILAGTDRVRIHGLEYPVRAEIAEIASLSAHADQRELLDWVAPVAARIERIYLTHGEPDASATLAGRLKDRWRAHVHVPALGELAALD